MSDQIIAVHFRKILSLVVPKVNAVNRNAFRKQKPMYCYTTTIQGLDGTAGRTRTGTRF